MKLNQSRQIVIIISANSEWKALVNILSPSKESILYSPYGQYFVANNNFKDTIPFELLFFQGGWGKIDAAASAQWVIKEINPQIVFNLGTAGGFLNRANVGEIIYVTRTIIYDIVERMGSMEEALNYYTTELDTMPKSLVGYATPSPMISADQDIDPQNINKLMQSFDAVAADWESGSIAHICKKNGIKIIILKIISDVVDHSGSRTYENLKDFERKAESLMPNLLKILEKYLLN